MARSPEPGARSPEPEPGELRARPGARRAGPVCFPPGPVRGLKSGRGGVRTRGGPGLWLLRSSGAYRPSGPDLDRVRHGEGVRAVAQARTALPFAGLSRPVVKADVRRFGAISANPAGLREPGRRRRPDRERRPGWSRTPGRLCPPRPPVPGPVPLAEPEQHAPGLRWCVESERRPGAVQAEWCVAGFRAVRARAAHRRCRSRQSLKP
jgi:hypothetical protein